MNPSMETKIKTCGQYDLVAVADPTDRVKEINEGNNMSYCPLRILARINNVSEGPDLESTGCEPENWLVINGLFFGETKGSKDVRVGAGLLDFSGPGSFWKTDKLSGYLDPTTSCGHHKVFLVQGNKVLSNEKDIVIHCCFAGWDPWPLPAGQQIAVEGRNFGSSQGNKKLMIGGQEVSIVSWTTNQIVFIAPSLPPGTHEVQMLSNNEVVSWPHQIDIQ
jgi:hypothetical protein